MFVYFHVLQISLKAEMEVAMKLLEKDIHEKQDTIISLRRQLDDIKTINLEMYRKLQVSRNHLAMFHNHQVLFNGKTSSEPYKTIQLYAEIL